MATITIKNVDKLTRKLNQIANMELDKAMNDALVIVHGHAKSNAPVNKGGGAGLSGSIHMSKRRTPNGLEGQVFTNLEYAPYVEFGTGIKGNGTYPYKIKGLNLSYRDTPWFIPAEEIDDKTAEKYHFIKIHGKDGADFYICYGQPAHPFMYPALKDNEALIIKKFNDRVKNELLNCCKGGK